jgi:3-hydroxyisobutyrate dehydrogenase
MPPLGFVGLGQMGGRMARHLLDDGHELVAFDLDSAALDRTVEAGATAAASAADVAERADVVFLSLPGPAAVEAVVEDLAGVVDDESVLVDLSTTTPTTSRNVADRLADSGATVLGAPVSGGTSGAEAGTLTVMAGGDAATVEACRPYFEAFAADVFHIGDDPGHGNAVKLLNNYLSNVALVATSEAITLGREAGLDPERMCEVFNVSSGQNTSTMEKFPERILPGEDIGFALGLMEKDMRLLSQFAEEYRTPLLVESVVHNQVSAARARFGDDGDMGEIYDYVESTSLGE